MTLEQGVAALQRRSRVASAVIVVYIVLCAMMMLLALGLINGTVNFDRPENLNVASAIGSMAAIAYIAVFFISVIVVGMWIYRAHANLFAAGAEGLEYSPGWSVGWFFVPVANLFKPFQAMRELWTISHNTGDSFNSETPPELIPWWGGYLIGGLLKNMSTRLGELGTGGYVLDLVGSIVLIVSAWCLLRIIRAVTLAQANILTATEVFA